MKTKKSLHTVRQLPLIVAIAGSSFAGTAFAAEGPCDIYAKAGTPCAAAHSMVRALYANYNGNLYQVRRADGKLKDIPVESPGGYANTSLQDSFCANSKCTISKLYDQTDNHNDLVKSPKVFWLKDGGVEAEANKAPIMANGHKVYGIYRTAWSKISYRNNNTKGIATGDQEEAMYMVVDGKHYNDQCCFNYGNVETTGNDDGPGTMEAVYFGSDVMWGGYGQGKGPWVAADLEDGVFKGSDAGYNYGKTHTTPWPTAYSIIGNFVTAMLKGPADGTFKLKGGDAQKDSLITVWDGPRKKGYSPRKLQGAIVAGSGGDGSDGGAGTFFEGVMTLGCPPDSIDKKIQRNIAAAGFGSSIDISANFTEPSNGTTSKETSPNTKNEAINNLVKTPPMGWNSWNVFHENINEKQIKEIADIMVSSGMRDAGYIYLNLDDNWMAKSRDANGDLTHDPDRFPSGMKALGDYIHSKGLKFGIYGDRGKRTCHHYYSNFVNSGSGSYMNEERDAKKFASWGVDYLKYDNCDPAQGSNQQQDYERMRDALLKSGRDIVYSICAWEYKDWMPKTGNLWRTTGDISNAWSTGGGFFRGVAEIIEENEKHYIHAGPGHWNDPDMLQVGNGKLTDNEARTQMTMWSIMAAPLLTGNDIRKMTATIKDIYMNADMIAVNQDSAGIAGHRIKNSNGKQIWTRPLGGESSGKIAVALYNSSNSEQTIDLDFKDVGIDGEASVRDVWQKKDLGLITKGLSSNVPSHGVTFLIITAKLDPAEPYNGKAVEIPGKIEAENFDKGSAGLAYNDNSSENEGKSYRTDTGVDIVQLDPTDKAKGYAIGYTQTGEWLNYTVKVTKAGIYTMVANVSSGAENSGFVIFVDGKPATDTLIVPKGDNWDNYGEITAKTKELTEGEHTLRIFITGNFVNIDWLKFCAGESCDNSTIAIRKAYPIKQDNNHAPRLRKKDGQVFIEKNGKRFDLIGHQLH